MSKKVDDSILDAALNEIKNKVTKMTVCSAEPRSYAAANNGGSVFLGDVTMESADFIITNGDVSGRKCRVSQKSNVNIDVTGTATHVALLDTATSKLLYVTTSTSLALTSGNTLTFNAWDIEIADPS